MATFLQATSEENLYLCILHGAWGSKSNSLTHWKSGDIIIAYVERALAAQFEIVGDTYFDEIPVWSNELYPYRIPIQLQKVIHPNDRYSISSADTREVLFKYHTPSYGISVVLAKKPLHNEAATVLLSHVEDSPNWDEFDAEYELQQMQHFQKQEQDEIADSVVQARQDVLPDEEASVHTKMQFYLAQLGQSLGFQIWIPKPDQGKQVDGTYLGNLSVPELPRLPFSDDVVRIIQYIDVIWLQHQNPIHLFEVEYSTSIYSGLLRMSDLAALIPSLNVNMYVCATEDKRKKVAFEVNRPTFMRLPVPLVERCRYIPIEQLTIFMDSQRDYLRHFSVSILDEVSESLAL